ncbi:type II toxin-antitoxin system death-on-curing family toxin [Staphylococcus sp. HMSC036D05]|uniref:type II toxin-antitoxin system death-on-curing family toxin n=1 Tax=Staphylococcus sp. HMSC036D05 TaxID=1715059 RepID=UPI0008A8B0E5|nr:type II toxin-antitoxin system death-on-curing family toxin [Staphylococcus sp. HMSC036D05]
MKYLSEKDLILLNTFVIKEYSPKEFIGVKEPTALNMTIESVKQNVFGQELYYSVEMKGANLYRNIVKKHIFFNGNKRTAFMALNIFLRKNGLILEVNSQEAVEFTVKIATENLEEKIIVEWIRKHTKTNLL